MDFTALDSRTASETPRPLHIKHQATGEAICDGEKPCIVLVLGSASRSVQAAIKDQARTDMKNAKTAQDEARALEDLQAAMIVAASRLIVGFENISRGDKPATKDDAKWFLDLNFVSMAHQMRKTDDEWTKPSFAQQVLDFAAEDAGFLGQTPPV